MKSNYEPLGKHIQLVDYRNSEEVTSTVLGIAYQAVLEVNRNDISSELRKYVNDDIQLSAIIEYMGYDEGVLHEHEGNVFFVNESNWLIARLVNHMTGEIVQDDIILDSGSITDVLNSRDAFFDYIFGTENH